jgi:hypothetical protein
MELFVTSRISLDCPGYLRGAWHSIKDNVILVIDKNIRYGT